MKQIWIYIRSEHDATDEPIFRVLVGRSELDRLAHAELAARALVDPSIFYCKADAETRAFEFRLFIQNPDREVFQCSPADLLRIIKNRASADHVENLSERFRSEWCRTILKSHLIPKK